MVSREHISKSFDYAIFKCNDYPKAIALRYYKEHKDNFVSDTYPTGADTESLPSPVGRLQQIQADLQEQIDYKSLERGVLHDYSTNSFIALGMMLNNVPNWMDECDFLTHYISDNGDFMLPVLDSPNNDGRGDWHSMSVQEESDRISKVIDKSPRVQEDCIVYRYGELPLDIEVGGHGTFKSFTSTSYNPYIAFDNIPNGGTWVQGSHEQEVRYKMRIFTPSGTKGVVLNEHTGCMDWQSELLLDKGQRYIVLARNDKEKTADILLY